MTFERPILFKRRSKTWIEKQDVPIKFRGKSKESGEYVYGSYLYLYNCRWGHQHYIVNDGSYQCEVDIDTVRQLVGYDAAGNEIYEGDILGYKDENEFLYIAELLRVVGDDTADHTPDKSGRYSGSGFKKVSD